MKRLLCFHVLLFLGLCVSCDLVDEEQEAAYLHAEYVEIVSDYITDKGGKIEISVHSNRPWEIDADADWCNVAPDSGEAGSYIVSVSVEPNDGFQERSVDIIVTNGELQKKLALRQEEKNAILLSDSEVNVSYEETSFMLTFETNADYSVEIASDCQDWLFVDMVKSMQEYGMKVFVSENPWTEAREGIINIISEETSQSVKVIQEGAIPCIIISEKEFHLPSSISHVYLDLRYNVGIEMVLPEVDWIHYDEFNSTYSFKHFIISENSGYDSRSAEILFRSEEYGISEVVTIWQDQMDALVVADEQYEVSCDGGNLNFILNTNCDSFKVDVSADWLEYLPDVKSLSEYELQFKADPNDTETERKAYITITSGDLVQKIGVWQWPSAEYQDRAVLRKLYEDYDGASWANYESWGTDLPINQFYGVTTNGQGRVIKLILNGITIEDELDAVFDFTKLDYLEHLEVSDCAIENFILSGSEHLNSMVISKKQYGSMGIDASRCVNLRNLSLNGYFSYIDISDCISLSSFTLSGDNPFIRNLNAKGCVNLRSIPSGSFTNIDLTNCRSITELYLSNCGLSTLCLEGCTGLTVLKCDTNWLETLDVSGFRDLVELSCHTNRLKELNLKGCVSLTGLVYLPRETPSIVALEKLMLDGCENMQNIRLNRCNLNSLDVSNFKYLTELDCHRCGLEQLNVAGCTSLKELNCSLNNLTELNLSSCSLRTLACAYNEELKSLNISKNNISLLTNGWVYVDNYVYGHQYPTKGVRSLEKLVLSASSKPDPEWTDFVHIDNHDARLAIVSGVQDYELYRDLYHIDGWQYPEISYE